MSDVLLSVEHLAATYDQAIRAVSDVSFSVPAGEIVAVLGANGAGKSTTLQAVSALLPARRDARGRPRKRAFGQWIQTPLRLLAQLKVLRGTPFDVFGYTAERRAERELIGWYEALIDTMLGKLDAARLADLVAIAKAPMEIRGYGSVKDAAIDKTKAEVARLTALLTPAPSDTHDGSGRRAALGG